jgi:hypothetical protein
MRYRALAAIVSVFLAGCSFVKYTEAGARVRVAAPADVASCERIGTVSAKTTDKLVLPRVEEKVKAELDTLACNEGAALGGDTVVPDGPREAGTQRYIVYRCR